METPDVDEELLARAQTAEPGALEELFERHLPKLHAFVRIRARGVVRAREDVSDLVQSVCREVLADLPETPYESELHFKRWLYQAALRKIVDKHRYWRAQRRDPARELSKEDEQTLGAIYGSIVTPSQVALGREAMDRLEAAFDRLPEDYREVICAARILGESHAQIAAQLGRTEGAVRVLLSRALARLATLLDEGEKDPSGGDEKLQKPV